MTDQDVWIRIYATVLAAHIQKDEMGDHPRIHAEASRAATLGVKHFKDIYPSPLAADEYNHWSVR